MTGIFCNSSGTPACRPSFCLIFEPTDFQNGLRFVFHASSDHQRSRILGFRSRKFYKSCPASGSRISYLSVTGPFFGRLDLYTGFDWTVIGNVCTCAFSFEPFLGGALYLLIIPPISIILSAHCIPSLRACRRLFKKDGLHPVGFSFTVLTQRLIGSTTTPPRGAFFFFFSYPLQTRISTGTLYLQPVDMTGADLLGLRSLNRDLAQQQKHPYAPSLSSSASSSSSSIFSLDGVSSQSSISSTSTNPVDLVSEGECCRHAAPNSTNEAGPRCLRSVISGGITKPTDNAVPPEQRRHGRRTNGLVAQSSSCLRPPPCLVRQSQRKVNFVDNLVGE